MARRQRGGGPEISLFPFLSILACVIGTLTLMITALALGQMDNPTVESAEKFEKSKQELADELRQIDRLKAEIDTTRDQSDRRNSDIVAARAEIERLVAELQRLKDQPPPTAEIPAVDVAGHKQDADRLRSEIKNLEQRVEQLLAEVARRKKPEEAVVKIQPGGTGTNLKPTFVECAASRILIYNAPQPYPVPKGKLNTDAVFVELLDRIAKSDKETVVFLVRDDAVGTYFAARNIARSKYARNGKLPVLGQGKIDLSLFKR